MSDLDRFREKEYVVRPAARGGLVVTLYGHPGHHVEKDGVFAFSSPAEMLTWMAELYQLGTPSGSAAIEDSAVDTALYGGRGSAKSRSFQEVYQSTFGGDQEEPAHD